MAAIGLVGANAFFVGAEFALVAVDRTRVDERARQGSRAARRVQALLDRVSYHLSGAQLGITVSSLILGFLAEPAIAEALEPALDAVFGSTPRSLSIGLALVIATVVQMVLGELVPKSLATSRPLEASFAMARPTAVYGAFAGPIIGLLDGLASRLTRAVGVEPAHEIEATPDRVELEPHPQFGGGGHARRRRGRAPHPLDPAGRQVRRRCHDPAGAGGGRRRPRDGRRTRRGRGGHRALAVPGDGGRPRRPDRGRARQGSPSVPVGQRSDPVVRDLMAPVLAVPERRDLDELLVELRAGGQQLAVVIDEHGGTAGIITLEDVLEELVGEIDDEHDEITASLTRVEAKGSTVIPASLHPDEVREATGFVMPEGEYETLAGLVLDCLGRIPTPGESCKIDGWRLEVVAMERLRIATVRVVAPREHDR
ncbi:MAG: hemolysin family protein [Acidimicrobiales bacterium]